MRGARGQRLATAVDGAGPPLVLPAWWVSHAERDFAIPRFRRFFAALAEQHTVVRYDRAGVGLSDRGRESFSLDQEAADLEAVLDGLELERTSLLAISCGGPPAIALAARRPERVERLIVFGGYLHGPGIGRPDVQKALVALVRASWGLGSRALCDIFLPGADEAAARIFAESQAHAATAEMSANLLELTYAMDVRDVAADVTAPTLVVHRRNDRAIGHEHGRQVAAAIPGAELVTVEGNQHLPWDGDADSVLAAIGAAPPATQAPSDGDGPELSRDGDVWTVRFRGRTVHAKHARGLADLAMLIAHPGRPFLALELMGAAVPAARAEAVLDDEARAQYRERLAQIEEGQAAADPERAAELEAERDAIVDELRAATGLGGRPRALRDEGERARKAVTGRIRESIARLGRLDAALGEHLDRSVETGTTCVYRPARPS